MAGETLITCHDFIILIMDSKHVISFKPIVYSLLNDDELGKDDDNLSYPGKSEVSAKDMSTFNEEKTELYQEEQPYRFPYEEYKIVGDISEIDKIISTCGNNLIDVIDIKSTLSKDTINYVSSGYAEGSACIANALKCALDKLPIEVCAVSKLLLNVWKPRKTSSRNELYGFIDIFKERSANIDIIWGVTVDESLDIQQAKATIIAASENRDATATT